MHFSAVAKIHCVVPLRAQDSFDLSQKLNRGEVGRNLSSLVNVGDDEVVTVARGGGEFVAGVSGADFNFHASRKGRVAP